MSDPELLRSLLEAPDRDRCPGAPEIVSYREDDEPPYLCALDRHARRRVHLTRRGIWHGSWAELGSSADPSIPHCSDWVPPQARRSQRWFEAKPILLRAVLPPERCIAAAEQRKSLFEGLHAVGGLRRFLERAALPGGYRLGPDRPLADPERDIECLTIAGTPTTEGPLPPKRGEERRRELWVKSGRLSTYPEDRSLRLRISFGRELLDDASRDHAGHCQVAALAHRLLPETAWLEEPPLEAPLRELVGERVLLTQHIAYWNAPGGGARFHHDSFAEQAPGGQLGVVYAQLGGSTAWLALSSEDLAARILEFLEYMQAGELAWVREELWPGEREYERALALAHDPRRTLAELARPGQGALGSLVNRGPEFTSFLADAGHAFLLDPGDVLLLPNHGLSRTCMHSVFCADPSETAYGLSAAIRSATPPPEERPPSLRRQRRERRRRR